MRRVVVVGTGTEIGKTHTSVALVAALARAGVRVAGCKPIESGVSEEAIAKTDAGRLAALSSAPCGMGRPLYAFAPAVSPHLAARRAGVLIDLGRVAAWVDGFDAEVLVIETAGALLSPLSRVQTNLDLARALRPDGLVLVAPDRLGVLHDVAATLHALRTLSPELVSPVLVLSPPALPDTSTGLNAAELAWLGFGDAIVLPRAASTDEGCIRAALQLARALGLLADI